VAKTETDGIRTNHPVNLRIHVIGWFLNNNPKTIVNHVPKTKKEESPRNLKIVPEIQVPMEPIGFLDVASGNSYWVGNGGSCPSIAIPNIKPKNSIPVATASQNQFLGLGGSIGFFVAKNKLLP
jgi:hypothetical protein